MFYLGLCSFHSDLFCDLPHLSIQASDARQLMGYMMGMGLRTIGNITVMDPAVFGVMVGRVGHGSDNSTTVALRGMGGRVGLDRDNATTIVIRSMGGMGGIVDHGSHNSSIAIMGTKGGMGSGIVNSTSVAEAMGGMGMGGSSSNSTK